MSPKEYTYSEIFHSIQGEGHYTGVPTAWIRFFLCNLQCSGFGQKDPTNPDTYELPFEDFDVDSVNAAGAALCASRLRAGGHQELSARLSIAPRYLQVSSTRNCNSS